MNESSCIRAVVEFQLAIIKELYKNNKIGIKEYEYAIAKLQAKLEKIIIPKGLVPAILDINV